ncbi:hypothetical protein GCM10027614_68100 [Micromonospora vulcania]
MSTARGYQTTLRLFMEYVTDARYSWPRVCHQRFGQAPSQIFHEANTIAHVTEYEGQPHRRPLTYDEVQALFDAADARVGAIRSRGRKGALAALRDAALLKTIYAFGLRRREAWGLDLADLRHNPKAPAFGRYGAVFVRYGKSSNGSPPKRRTVLTIPEMDWIVPVLEHWLGEVRPAFSPGAHPAMWVTERCSRLARRRINAAFEAARGAAGLPSELDLHCLRHSYVTHLVEFDYPAKFVRDQVGHEYESTTAIYTGCRTSTATECCNAAWPSGIRICGRTHRDQEDGLCLASAPSDGRLRHVPDHRAGAFVGRARCPPLANRSSGWSPSRRSGCRWIPSPPCATFCTAL